MKKVSLLLALFLGSYVCAYADYTQTLPLDYTDFFRAEALNADGEHLEVYTYANSDQKSSSKPAGEDLHGDQWNCSGNAADQKGENPVVAASTLEYGNYVDNKKGKEIILANLPLEDAKSVTRASIYSLQKSYAYAGKAYYLAALVQINEATGKGDILTMDGNYTANAQRGRMYVNKEGKGYKLGLGWNGEPATYTGELAFGSTHLVVIKMIPCGNASGVTESAMLWVDPDMTKTEAENVAVSTLADQTAGLKSVRGITIRQRSKISGKIAGLRFGESWEDVVKTEDVSVVEKIETDFGDGTWGEIDTDPNNAVNYTGNINGFSFIHAGLAQSSKSFNGRNLTNYVVMANLSSGGMITLPAVSDVESVTIYAQAGTAERDMYLQCFNYATNLWSTVATYHFEDKDIHVFSTILKRNGATLLRLVNADNSKKFIWRIETLPFVNRSSVVTDFSNVEIWGSPANASYGSGTFPTSNADGINLIKAGLVKKSIVYTGSGEYFPQRMEIDTKSNGGMIILPPVTSIARVDIFANVGGANPTFNLDSFSYSTDQWVTIETITIGATCARISKNLNSTSTTRLRIANADGSVKNIYKIITYASNPTDLEVPVVKAATNVSSKAFSANWETVEGATGYRIILYNGDNSVKSRVMVEAGVTTLPLRNLIENTNYTYKVAAVGDGETTVDSELSEAVPVTTAPEINDVYTRTVTNGNYGTICLPKASEDLRTAGAVFFEVAGKVMVNDQLSEIVFDEVTSLVAGKPYVFLAKSDELNIPLVGDAVDTVVTKGTNGLKGSFTVKAITGTANRYVLSNNLLYCTYGREYYVGENRAYFDISSMEVFDSSAPKAPGRRRVSMKAEPQQTPTGIGATETGSKPAKLLLNGSVVIIRNGVQYDITGKRIH